MDNQLLDDQYEDKLIDETSINKNTSVVRLIFCLFLVYNLGVQIWVLINTIKLMSPHIGNDIFLFILPTIIVIIGHILLLFYHFKTSILELNNSYIFLPFNKIFVGFIILASIYKIYKLLGDFFTNIESEYFKIFFFVNLAILVIIIRVTYRDIIYFNRYTQGNE